VIKIVINIINSNLFNTQATSKPRKHNPTKQRDNIKEGNYYNTHNGQDTNNNGIGDTPYILKDDATDNYSLMSPINPEQIPQPKTTP
jgi:hypothetical protein